MQKNHETFEFTHEFTRPFLIIFACGAVAGILTGAALVGTWVFTTRAGVLLLARALIGGALVAGLSTVAWTKLLRVRVSVHGFSCYSVRGIRFTPWPDIERVRPHSVLGLRFVRVWARGEKRPVHLPLFLTDMRGFRSRVGTLAGRDSLLVRSLI